MRIEDKYPEADPLPLGTCAQLEDKGGRRWHKRIPQTQSDDPARAAWVNKVWRRLKAESRRSQ